MEQNRYSGVPDLNGRPIHGAQQVDDSTGYTKHDHQIYRRPDSHSGVASTTAAASVNQHKQHAGAGYAAAGYSPAAAQQGASSIQQQQQQQQATEVMVSPEYLAYSAVSGSSIVSRVVAAASVSPPVAASAPELGGGPPTVVKSTSDSPRRTLGVSCGSSPTSIPVGLPSAFAQRLAAQQQQRLQQQQRHHSYSSRGSVPAETGSDRSVSGMNEGFVGVGQQQQQQQHLQQRQHQQQQQRPPHVEFYHTIVQQQHQQQKQPAASVAAWGQSPVADPVPVAHSNDTTHGSTAGSNMGVGGSESPQQQHQGNTSQQRTVPAAAAVAGAPLGVAGAAAANCSSPLTTLPATVDADTNSHGAMKAEAVPRGHVAAATAARAVPAPVEGKRLPPVSRDFAERMSPWALQSIKQISKLRNVQYLSGRGRDRQPTGNEELEPVPPVARAYERSNAGHMRGRGRGRKSAHRGGAYPVPLTRGGRGVCGTRNKDSKESAGATFGQLARADGIGEDSAGGGDARSEHNGGGGMSGDSAGGGGNDEGGGVNGGGEMKGAGGGYEVGGNHDSGGGGAGVLGGEGVEGGGKEMVIEEPEGEASEGLCLPGTEQTGRWTNGEHELFLKALKKYGKEWKRVACMVRTRTVVQTRTHAQKYFQKLDKAVTEGGISLEDGEGPDRMNIDVHMNTIDSSQVTSANSASRTRRGSKRSRSSGKSTPPSQHRHPGLESAEAAAAAAAVVMGERGGLRAKSQRRSYTYPCGDDLKSTGDEDCDDEEGGGGGRRAGGSKKGGGSHSPLSTGSGAASAASGGSRPSDPSDDGHDWSGHVGVATVVGTGPSKRRGHRDRDRGTHRHNYSSSGGLAAVAGGGPGGERYGDGGNGPGSSMSGGGGRGRSGLQREELCPRHGGSVMHDSGDSSFAQQQRHYAALAAGERARRLGMLTPVHRGRSGSGSSNVGGLGGRELKWSRKVNNLPDGLPATRGSMISTEQISNYFIESFGSSNYCNNNYNSNNNSSSNVNHSRTGSSPLHRSISHGQVAGALSLIANAEAKRDLAQAAAAAGANVTGAAAAKAPVTATTSASASVVTEGFCKSVEAAPTEGAKDEKAGSTGDAGSGGDVLLEFVNEADKFGYTPLMLAATLDRAPGDCGEIGTGPDTAYSLCEALLGHGARRSAVDPVGNTALHWAAWVGNHLVVQLLISNTTPEEINCKNEEGDSALHFASRWGRETAVRALLTGGASADVVNSKGCIPLEVAGDGNTSEGYPDKESTDRVRKEFFKHYEARERETEKEKERETARTDNTADGLEHSHNTSS